MDNKTSADSSSSDRDNYLRHLNKLSHKISKPILNNNNNNKKTSSFEQQQQQQPQINNNPLHQNPQHQPPVYNINKNDFRDVVQKLTGSPAHDRISTPPPIQQPKQQSSRLQRIRPPPLPHITNRPPPLLNSNVRPHLPPSSQNFNFNGVSFNQSFSGFGRPQAPLSPLPPFPTVHAAAESPISAYMRDLQNFVSTMVDSKSFSGFSPLPPPPLPVSSHQTQPEQQQQQPQQEEQEQQQENQPPPQHVVAPPAQLAQSLVAQSQSPFQMPSSPVPFGCLNSQLASYPLLSPGLMFSPNSANLGFPQLPLSPTVPSPRWREI